MEICRVVVICLKIRTFVVATTTKKAAAVKNEEL